MNGRDTRPEQPAPGELPGGSETILLVEDDPGVRTFASTTLTRFGYRVIEAASGDEAIRLAAAAGAIDLLLADVVMPGPSGGDLAERLREHRPRMAVLYMSGYANAAILDYGVLTPGTAFLSKPFKPGDLLHRVRGVLDAARLNQM